MNDKQFKKVILGVVFFAIFFFVFMVGIVLIVYRDNIIHGNKEITRNSTSGYNQYPSTQYPSTQYNPTQYNPNNPNNPNPNAGSEVPVGDNEPPPTDPEARQL